ncbi:MAG: aminotransferase class V-fold PLP-dependent enzyme [Bacteroidales bacterium]|nr:aminotransferase class V-fold PLP-dependent enzyme [Bacteroidales bacterium]
MNKSFASDNWAAACPEVMEAIVKANNNYAAAYGDDDYTKVANQEFKKLFGSQAETFFVYNGTAANILALNTVSSSFNAVICSEHAHINMDECGGFENISGAKLLDIPTDNGKLKPTDIFPYIEFNRAPHQSVPKVITITQASELGTIYTIDEIKELADFAHKHNLLLHVDGARIANAVVALNTDFKSMITNTGVDMLSFGGTKNGMMFGEAVVFLKPELAKHFELYRKQGMQLHSKMRFIATQFIALLKNEVWRKNAQQANEMAQYLALRLQEIPEITFSQKVESNGIWAIIPKRLAVKMQNAHFFYPWNESKNEYRLMCSWDTSKEEIDAFMHTLK